jgi:hypothetical protein
LRAKNKIFIKLKLLHKMSDTRDFGKDKVVFVTRDEHSERSKIELPPNEPQPGKKTLILFQN